MHIKRCTTVKPRAHKEVHDWKTPCTYHMHGVSHPCISQLMGIFVMCKLFFLKVGVFRKTNIAFRISLKTHAHMQEYIDEKKHTQRVHRTSEKGNKENSNGNCISNTSTKPAKKISIQ